MFPTWRKTAQYYSEPDNKDIILVSRTTRFSWLIVDPIRMPVENPLIMNVYENDFEFILFGLNFILGSIYVNKKDLIDLGESKPLFFKKNRSLVLNTQSLKLLCQFVGKIIYSVIRTNTHAQVHSLS